MGGRKSLSTNITNPTDMINHREFDQPLEMLAMAHGAEFPDLEEKALGKKT